LESGGVDTSDDPVEPDLELTERVTLCSIFGVEEAEGDAVNAFSNIVSSEVTGIKDVGVPGSGMGSVKLAAMAAWVTGSSGRLGCPSTEPVTSGTVDSELGDPSQVVSV